MGDDCSREVNSERLSLTSDKINCTRETLWFGAWAAELFTFHLAVPVTTESHWSSFYLPLAI